VNLAPGWQLAAILENYSGIARFPCDSTAFLLRYAWSIYLECFCDYWQNVRAS